jgi:hypothetical protein
MTQEFAMTLTTPRQGRTLVETHHSIAGSQLLHNSIRITGFAPVNKPTTYAIKRSQLAQTEQFLILELDGGSIFDCQSGIRRGDGSIILNIDSKPNLNSLFILCT